MKKYLQGVFEEVKKIHWLPLNRALVYTVIVIVVALFVGYLLRVFDFIFSYILGSFLI